MLWDTPSRLVANLESEKRSLLFRTVFREKALARRSEREAVDARLQVTAPHEWLLLSGLAVALLALLAYGLLGRAERSLMIEAVVIQPGERVDVVVGGIGRSGRCPR